jgi:hypothetical protein
MKPERLVRFYPRAWRERYGEEFLETVGSDSLRTQQILDITFGALDAWLSADVRQSARAMASPYGGHMQMKQTWQAMCGATALRFSTRDIWIGCLVMVVGTVVILLIGDAAGRSGYPMTGEILKSVAFPVCLTLMMPFIWLKGQPWKAQLVVLGVTFLMLAGATYVATLI